MSSNNIAVVARRWAIAGGLFNCIASFPLAMPFLHEWYISLLNDINIYFGIGGVSWNPPTNGGNMLLVNTAGLVLFLVGMILIYVSMNMAERVGILFLNGIARILWGIMAIYYIIFFGVLNVLYLIVAVEFILASANIYYYFKLRNLGKANVYGVKLAHR